MMVLVLVLALSVAVKAGSSELLHTVTQSPSLSLLAIHCLFYNEDKALFMYCLLCALRGISNLSQDLVRGIREH